MENCWEEEAERKRKKNLKKKKRRLQKLEAEKDKVNSSKLENAENSEDCEQGALNTDSSGKKKDVNRISATNSDKRMINDIEYENVKLRSKYQEEGHEVKKVIGRHSKKKKKAKLAEESSNSKTMKNSSDINEVNVKLNDDENNFSNKKLRSLIESNFDEKKVTGLKRDISLSPTGRPSKRQKKNEKKRKKLKEKTADKIEESIEKKVKKLASSHPHNRKERRSIRTSHPAFESIRGINNERIAAYGTNPTKLRKSLIAKQTKK